MLVTLAWSGRVDTASRFLERKRSALLFTAVNMHFAISKRMRQDEDKYDGHVCETMS